MRYQCDTRPIGGGYILCKACGEPLRSSPIYDSQPCNRKRCKKKRAAAAANTEQP